MLQPLRACHAMANLGTIAEKLQITSCEKSHCEFSIAVLLETSSSSMLNKIATALTMRPLIGSVL